jgi:hypothetical protein
LPPEPPAPPSPPPQAADGNQQTTPLPGRARGFAPQPTASGLTPPLSDTTVREWPPGPNAGGDPDWLTERLARDAAVHDRTEWNGRWRNRLASWGAAGVLLALLAGGGFWLYEQSRVEGALVVVANTNPAPDANVLRTDRVPEPPIVPKSAPVSTADKSAAILAPVSALPSATLPAPRPVAPDVTGAGSGAGAVGGSVGPSTASSASLIDTSPSSVTDRTVKSVALDAEPAPAPRRARSQARSQARKQGKPQQEARARTPDAEPSARQRREETLLQCRAHGYDERQCIQRGCEMTRYGFACKG